MEMEKALAWLKAPDFQTNHENARALEQEGTGQWFIQGEEFRTWFGGSHENLWLQAIRKLILSGSTMPPADVATKLAPVKQFSGESTSLKHHNTYNAAPLLFKKS
jgi:hypothetical protein